MNANTNPTASLKWASVAFAVLWTGGMIWWSGHLAAAEIVILTICGAVAGYLWYRLMCWQFRRRGRLTRDNTAGTTAK